MVTMTTSGGTRGTNPSVSAAKLADIPMFNRDGALGSQREGGSLTKQKHEMDASASAVCACLRSEVRAAPWWDLATGLLGN